MSSSSTSATSIGGYLHDLRNDVEHGYGSLIHSAGAKRGMGYLLVSLNIV